MAKRLRTDRPCFLCEKAGIECDGQRPCRKCVNLGIAHMCLGVEMKDIDAFDKNSVPLPGGQQQQSFQKHFSQNSSSPSTSSSSSSSSSSSKSRGFDNFSKRNPNMNPPFSAPTLPPGSNHSIFSRDKQDSTQNQSSGGYKMNHEDSSMTTASAVSAELLRANLNESNQSVTPVIHRSLPSNRLPLTHSGTEIAPAQHSLNTYILNEIRKVKEDNRRLHDEVLNLRLENLKISSMIPSDRRNRLMHAPFLPDLQEHSSTALALSAGKLEVAKEKPMVVYDLQSHPPTVLTTNSLFCTLIGYSLDEVIGSPWQKYIHEDYIERTMQILSQKAESSYIRLEQVYRHKDGHLFATYDVHTILHDSAGNFIADTVTITPFSTAANGSDAVGQLPAIGYHDLGLSQNGDDGVEDTSMVGSDPVVNDDILAGGFGWGDSPRSSVSIPSYGYSDVGAEGRRDSFDFLKSSGDGMDLGSMYGSGESSRGTSLHVPGSSSLGVASPVETIENHVGSAPSEEEDGLMVDENSEIVSCKDGNGELGFLHFDV